MRRSDFFDWKFIILDIRLTLFYQIYLKLVYKIARCHAPEGNKGNSENETYNSKLFYR